MEHSLSADDREYIWIAMSEFFVDNEIDYHGEAKKIAKFPLNELEEIFFREVAPACGPNLLTPAPPVWDGFEPETVVTDIKSILSNKDRSIFQKIIYEANIAYYRIRLADVWRKVEDALTKVRTSHQG